MRSAQKAARLLPASTRLPLFEFVEPHQARKGLGVRAVLLLALVFAPPVVVGAAAQGQAPPPVTTAPRPRPSAPGGQMTTPFLGGVPSGTATSQPIALSIGDAIRRGLEHNLGVLTSQQGLEQARGARWLALSELLPNLNGRLAETRQKLNLEVFGF